MIFFKHLFDYNIHNTFSHKVKETIIYVQKLNTTRWRFTAHEFNEEHTK